MTVNNIFGGRAPIKQDRAGNEANGASVEKGPKTTYNDINNTHNEQSFRVYKRRWLLLLIPLGSDILLCFRSWRFPILNIIYPFWDTTTTQAVGWSILPLIINAILLIPAGHALDRWGIRKMAYINGPIIVASNVIQSLIMFDETNSPIYIPKEYRFTCFVFCNCLFMVSFANFNGFSAKLANDWFAMKETTLALVIPMIMGRLVESFVVLITPKIVKTQDDLKYIGYANFSMALIYGLITVTCITKSQPKIPPSENALKARAFSARQSESFPLAAFIKILITPAFPIAMFACGFNMMSVIILKGVFSEALSHQGYTNDFSGTLMAICAVTTCFGSFTATWLDRNYDYIKVSKFASLFVASFFSIHYMSQLKPNVANLILLSGVLLSFSLSILIPLQLQAMYRSSKGLLPDASVASINGFICVICYGILTAILNITKDSHPNPNTYYRPYLIICIIIILFNCIYAFLFHPPEPTQHKSVVGNSGDRLDTSDRKSVHVDGSADTIVH